MILYPTKDDVINYIVNSSRISEALTNICKFSEFDCNDFKQFFYLTILEKEEDKLIHAYSEGYIDYVCIRIMKVMSIANNNSPFYREINPKKTVEFEEFLFNIPQEDSNTNQGNEIAKKSIKILEDRPETFLEKQFHITLFKLYYIDGYKLREISDITDICKSTISNSVNRSFDYIRLNLGLDIRDKKIKKILKK